MREYVDASAVFGECLNRQVQLGARIVADSDILVHLEGDSGDWRACMSRLRQWRKDARSGKAELTRLKRVMTREQNAARRSEAAGRKRVKTEV